MFVLTLILTILISTASASEANLDSLITVQRERAGDRAEELFYVLDYGLNSEEERDIRFLLAYLSLGDIAMMNGDELLMNVRYARITRERFTWGSEVPDDIFRHFILPHRVSQEPFVNGWRQKFFEEIAPMVEAMTMSEAALEVNHWCHEVATFKRSSGRDQDALTTIRAGFGRCEEEMILMICALRSVGIPARQCYTPYWPHADNNHAWVELWADGKWYYAGGCEPKPDLSNAWFTSAAGRAMLVVSTAFGDYQGNEPVLKRYDRSTLINSTAVYGPAHEVKVKLVNRKGNPIPENRVIFNLFNYGALMPASSLMTDENGECVMTCGYGSWIISGTKKKHCSIMHITSDQEDVTLKLDKKDKIRQFTSIDYAPPPKPPDKERPVMDSLFKCRLSYEDSLRESTFWSVWAREVTIRLDSSFKTKPDSFLAKEMADQFKIDSAKTLEVLSKARGNWGHLVRFITGAYPGTKKEPLYLPDDIRMRFLLLETLTDKDYKDFSISALEDHYNNTTLDWSLAELAKEKKPLIWITAASRKQDLRTPTSVDSVEMERIKDYILAPRISWEPSTGWRGELINFLRSNPKLVSSKKDKKLIKWLRKNITIEDKADRLGPALAPDATLLLRRGRSGDLERLYIGLCRVRGIPSRNDPLSRRLEVWRDNEWQAVKIIKPKKGKKKPAKKGSLTIAYTEPDSVLEKTLYMRDWSVQQWYGDFGSAVDFGYKKAFNKIEWPQELPAGLYFLSTGQRRKDGSAPISLTWFEIKPGKEVNLQMSFRESKEPEIEKKVDEQIDQGKDSRQNHN
ncbi:MAG: transglutaminase domain-containing protein [Candidatus Hatepunaea meridiana]|nr:transglutaminase domain-containing protein [Candidatus Hatepunaea meridiana]